MLVLSDPPPPAIFPHTISTFGVIFVVHKKYVCVCVCGGGGALDVPALYEDDAAIYKKRIVDLLLSAELVLLALRRSGALGV